MEVSENAQFESFNDYPWLDYKKHKDTWLPVMGAGSNGEQYCIITHLDNKAHRAIITQEIYNMVMEHEGQPLEIRYTFEPDGQVGVELKEASEEDEGNG